MFELVVIPLMNVLADEDMTAEERAAGLVSLQEALGQQVEHPVSWSEDVADDAEFEADRIDPYFIFALRAVAAWLETHDSLEGFEVDDEPWLHESLDILDDEDGIKKFPHLLQADASEWLAFIPADFKEVFMVDMGEDEVEEDSDQEPEEEYFFVASLPRLRAELDVLKAALKIEDGLEDQIDDIVPDPEVDPLAGPRYGWLLMSARTNEGLERGLPMLLYFDDDAEEGEGEEEGEEEGDAEAVD